MLPRWWIRSDRKGPRRDLGGRWNFRRGGPESRSGPGGCCFRRSGRRRRCALSSRHGKLSRAARRGDGSDHDLFLIFVLVLLILVEILLIFRWRVCDVAQVIPFARRDGLLRRRCRRRVRFLRRCGGGSTRRRRRGPSRRCGRLLCRRRRPNRRCARPSRRKIADDRKSRHLGCGSAKSRLDPTARGWRRRDARLVHSSRR